MYDKNYLLSIMTGGSQRFEVRCQFIFDGKIREVNGILDTGCSKTLI